MIHIMKEFLFASVNFVLLMLFGYSSYAQSNPDSLARPIVTNVRDFSNYQGLQTYFLEQEMSFNKRFGDGIYLYSVTHEKINMPDPDPKYFRLNYENLLMLYTHNFSLGINPWKYNPDGFNAFISGRVGWGYDGADLFPKNVKEEKAKINSTLGVELELEKQAAKNFSLFAGVGLNYVAPEKFVDSLGVETGNSGTILDPFFGARYYFSPGKNAETKISLQAKIGFPFINGFKSTRTDASPFYFGFGAGITSLQSFSKKSEIGFMSLESGVFISPLSSVVSAQFTQPIRVMDNLSIGFNGLVGTGFGDDLNNDMRISSYWGLGIDLRFFAYRTSVLLNPYVGYAYNSYGYKIEGDQYRGGVNYFRIGNKIRLGENSNWFLDVNIAVPLGIDDNWITYATTRYDTVGVGVQNQYVAIKDTAQLTVPVNLDFNIGLVYKFRAPAERRTGIYRAKYDVFKEEYMAQLERPRNEPLPIDADADELVEKRIYLQSEVDTIFKVDTVRVNIEVASYPKLDVTNLRIGRYVDPKEAVVTFDDWSVVPSDTSSISKTPVTLLLVGFDKSITETNKIKDVDMYLVFNDLNRSRIFGYHYDKNNKMSRETKKGPLKLSGNDLFYGNYDEFVIPLKWLSNSKYDVNEIQRRTSWSNANYKIAFAEFDAELFKKVANACKDFGVSVMFQIDNLSDKETIRTAYLSNVLAGKKFIDSDTFVPEITKDAGYYMDCHRKEVIDQFELGSDIIITEQQRAVILEIMKHILHCKVSDISGYTDGVAFRPELDAKIDYMNELSSFQSDPLLSKCPALKQSLNVILEEWNDVDKSNGNKVKVEELCQKALSWRRIRQVLELLDKDNITPDNLNLQNLKVDLLGNQYVESRKQNPKWRKVEIGYVN